MKNLVVLSGAGMSAESGLRTFRDADGLWEGHDVMEVASAAGWKNNKKLVLDFYNERRRQLLETEPNKGHKVLALLQKDFDVQIITQNVDDLHERAGSEKVLHLHGELLKVRSTFNEDLIYDWKGDLNLGDFCEFNHQLRPHIVWFGEEVPLFPRAADMVKMADYILVVGTSMQVYPAAGLIHYKRSGVPVWLVDPRPAVNSDFIDSLRIVKETAVNGLPIVVKELLRT